MAATMSAEEDVADVDRVLAGEVQAFEGYRSPLAGAAGEHGLALLPRSGRAEEMAQEAFLRAWRGLAGWRRESSFSTWLFALAANVFRSELQRFPAVNVPLEDVAEPAGPATQHDGLTEKQSHEAVRRAVLALPQRYREPVVLYYFHEMDVAAASRTMGLPEGTVKARLARGRELLRKRFPHLNEQNAPLLGASLQSKKEVLQ